MTLAEFEKLVRTALEEIPDEIARELNNVDVVVEEWASKDQLVGTGIDEGNYLLGLYEGIPLTDRYGYDMVLPDKITLFQGAIEAICADDEELVRDQGHRRPRSRPPLRHRRRPARGDGAVG